MNIILSILLSSVAVLLTAKLLSGVSVKNFGTAILVAILLSVLDATLRPIMVFLTFPITIVTLGLFLLVINTLIILIISKIVTSFQVKNFWWALLFSIIVSIINSILAYIFS